MNRLGLVWWDYAVIVLYFAVVLSIGWFFSRSKKNAAEYLLGGRSMSCIPVAISMLMSVFSTYSLVMGPGEVFNNSMDYGIVSFFLPFVGVVSILIFTKFFFKINAFTPFAYLEYRYDKYVRLLAACCNCYSQILYGGMVLLTSAKIFEAAAGWPCWMSILLLGTVAVVYTRAGGLKAVIWTDVVQFAVMLFGMLALVWSLCKLNDGGAWGAIVYGFKQGHGYRRIFEKDFYSLSPYIRLTFWALLITQCWSSLGTGTGQMTVQRLMSTGTLKKAVRAQLLSACITIPVCLLLGFIGLAVFSYYSQHPDPAVTQGDLALFQFVATKLPILMPGFFIAAALAAAMSTMAGILSGDSAVWLKEFYMPYKNPDATDAQQVEFSQKATVMIGVLAISFAMLQYLSSLWLEQTMVEVGVVFGIFMVSVGLDNYVFAIFSRKASSVSFWSMMSFGYGFKVTMLLWYILSRRGEITFRESGNLGFSGPLSIWYVVIPAVLALLLFLAAQTMTRRKSILTARILGLLPLSVSFAALIWFVFSRTGDCSQPKVLSFVWAGMPGIFVNLLFMAGWHLWGPEVPRERYEGLIWGYSDKEISQVK